MKKIDSPVEICFYVSHGENVDVMVKTFAQPVEDLLSEYRRLAHGKIELKKLDPQPDSEAEESAKLDGIESLDQARALKGAPVSVAREALPEVDEGHYYLADLVGLEVMNEQGERLGARGVGPRVARGDRARRREHAAQARCDSRELQALAPQP